MKKNYWLWTLYLLGVLIIMQLAGCGTKKDGQGASATLAAPPEAKQASPEPAATPAVPPNMQGFTKQ